ncbi:hypothetical protein H1R20_g5360, partial [Candolleomyces eurysporus]
MVKVHEFDGGPSLKYLGLPPDYTPSPTTQPIEFLKQHLTHLPPNIVSYYGLITTPKQRTVIPAIRNRRLQYTQTAPAELSFVRARNSWPHLWEGRLQPGVEEAKEERTWVEKEFLAGNPTHVGKLPGLLRDFEEERENERVRTLRRVRESEELAPEEDSDSDEEDEEDEEPPSSESDPETDQERQAIFERRIKERFIYGLLDSIDYDKIDWNESLDVDDDREAQERWFEEDDE